MNYIGFRWWRAGRVNGELVLRSLVQNWDWNLDGVTRAVDFNGARALSPIEVGHEAPYASCSCGLHAWRRLSDALVGDWGQGYVKGYAPKDDDWTLVGGAVVTGGLVCLHGDEGLRAQQARPVAFAVEDRRRVHPIIRALATRFGVPIFTYDNLEKYAHEFGDRQPAA